MNLILLGPPEDGKRTQSKIREDVFKIPKNINRCDRCRGESVKRDEDFKEAVKKRLEVYDAETFPLIQYYKEKNQIRYINRQWDIQQISEKIKTVLSVGWP